MHRIRASLVRASVIEDRSRASDAGRFLDFDVGIRLPKASDFSLLPTVEGRYGDALPPLCIDREGKVRGYAYR